jgi:hypothetical protein
MASPDTAQGVAKRKCRNLRTLNNQHFHSTLCILWISGGAEVEASDRIPDILSLVDIRTAEIYEGALAIPTLVALLFGFRQWWMHRKEDARLAERGGPPREPRFMSPVVT